jgi:drug/metabolite transporter (DMT)-like permease
VVDSPYIPAEGARVERRPGAGYAMVLVAGALFAVNGTVAKVALKSGLSSLRLTEARCAGAFLGLALVLVAVRPASLRTTRRELAFLAVFGVFGVAFVQLFYFLSIRRLEIGVALLIQYLAPLLIALWVRFVVRKHVRRRIWIALALSLGGLSLVVDLWGGISLDGLGVAFALIGAVAYAVYVLLAERAVGRRDPLSLLAYGFLFASLFWTVAQPWWSFPFALMGRSVSLLGNLAGTSAPVWALIAWVVVLGTIVPFFLIVGALQHLSGARVAIVAMVEPVLATVVAWAWLDETLGAQQLVGGAIVLCGIAIAQSARE